MARASVRYKRMYMYHADNRLEYTVPEPNCQHHLDAPQGATDQVPSSMASSDSFVPLF